MIGFVSGVKEKDECTEEKKDGWKWTNVGELTDEMNYRKRNSMNEWK